MLSRGKAYLFSREARFPGGVLGTRRTVQEATGKAKPRRRPVIARFRVIMCARFSYECDSFSGNVMWQCTESGGRGRVGGGGGSNC